MRSLAIAALACAACSSGEPCADLGPPTGIATHAALLRLTVFPAGARCEDNHVAAGTSPLRVFDLVPTAPAPVDLEPGERVVYLAAFADAAGTTLIGEGCATVAIAGGATACLPLPLSAPRPSGCTKLTHMNGVGQTYEDCAALGAHDAHLATRACAAATSDAAACEERGCSGGSTARAVCTKGLDPCTCWTYTGDAKGHVHRERSCNCATTADPSWN